MIPKKVSVEFYPFTCIRQVISSITLPHGYFYHLPWHTFIHCIDGGKEGLKIQIGCGTFTFDFLEIDARLDYIDTARLEQLAQFF